MYKLPLSLYLLFIATLHTALIAALYVDLGDLPHKKFKKQIQVVYHTPIQQRKIEPQKREQKRAERPSKKISKVKRDKIVRAAKEHRVTLKEEPQTDIVTLSSENIHLESVEAEEYTTALASFFQTHLALPEEDNVHLEMTLFASGEIDGKAQVTSTSEKNQKYVEEMLAQLTFPSFEKYIPLKKKHEFYIIMENRR